MKWSIQQLNKIQKFPFSFQVTFDYKDAISNALDKLTKTSEPIMTKLYQNAKPENASQNQGQGPEVEVKPDDIKDAGN